MKWKCPEWILSVKDDALLPTNIQESEGRAEQQRAERHILWHFVNANGELKMTHMFSVHETRRLARKQIFAATPLFMGVALVQIPLNTPETNVMRAME